MAYLNAPIFVSTQTKKTDPFEDEIQITPHETYLNTIVSLLEQGNINLFVTSIILYQY